MSAFMACFAIGAWPLIDPDEGRYAEIPREMLERGDFITPRLDYLLYFEKPPLFYWSVAAAMHIFGLTEGAARIVPALCSVLTVMVAYALGCRMFGARAGFWGALVLATCALPTFLAHAVIIDGQLAFLFFSTLALWWFGHAASEEGRSGKARNFFLAFWFALALGVLDKGPVAVVLVAACLFAYAGLCRQWKAFGPMQWGLGIPLFFLVAAPWFYLVGTRNPSFNHFFWYVQHVDRFLGRGDTHDHQEPPYFFLLAMPVVLFPWTFLLPGCLAATRRVWPADTPRRRAAVFLAASALLVTGFFSVSSGKIVTYILPIVPCIALLIGCYIDLVLAGYDSVRGTAQEFRAPSPRPTSWMGGLAGLLVVIGTGFLAVGAKQFRKHDLPPTAWLSIAALVLVVWGIGLALLLAKGRLQACFAVIAGGYFLWFVTFLPVMADVVPVNSLKPLCAKLAASSANSTVLLNFDCPYSPSLSFYAAMRCKIIDYPAEEAFGISQESPAERAQWSPTGMGAVVEALRRASPTYVVVKGHKDAGAVIDQLKTEGVTAYELAWNLHRSIIGNSAAASVGQSTYKIQP